MDRTARMLRRTLLCAVFACPLALWRLNAALALQALWTLFAAVFLRPAPARWAKGDRSQASVLPRVLCALGPTLALGVLLERLSLRLLPEAYLPAARPLCALSAVLLQCGLLLSIRAAGKRRLLLCLLALALTVLIPI